MYRLTCYRRHNDEVVFQREFDTRDEVTEAFEGELDGDLADPESYTYELEERKDWVRIPFKIKVEF